MTTKSKKAHPVKRRASPDKPEGAGTSKGSQNRQDALKTKSERNSPRPQPQGGWLKTGTETDGWPIFDSMAQCSARAGIPLDRLKDWKKAGAPGFRNSRVYFGELWPWVAEKMFAVNPEGNGLPPVLTWDDVIAQQKFQERAGILVEFKFAMDLIREAVLPLRQFLLAMPTMLAQRCNPTDPLHAQKAIEVHAKQGMRMIADAEREKISKI